MEPFEYLAKRPEAPHWRTNRRLALEDGERLARIDKLNFRRVFKELIRSMAEHHENESHCEHAK